MAPHHSCGVNFTDFTCHIINYYVIISSIYIQKPHIEHNNYPYTKSLKSIIYIHATDTVYTVFSNVQNYTAS